MSQDMTRWAAECYALLEDGLSWNTSALPEEALLWAKATQRQIKSAAKFLLPEPSCTLLTKKGQFQDLLRSGNRMPYEKVCIACEDKSTTEVPVLLLIKSDFSDRDPNDEDSVAFSVNAFYKLNHNVGWNIIPFIWDFNFNGAHRVWDMLSKEYAEVLSSKERNDVVKNFTTIIQQAVGSLMLLLSCSNVSEQDIPISKLKRDRLKKKKLPVFEHKTLYIDDVKSARVDRGGTSAPKRQHHRRGHIRRLSSGNQVWVRPCLVGDPSLGFVSKDYVVRNRKH